ncbi:Hint domain-containing protein [Defluviimonas sp. WL0002]|uniref:Hint domain-containing protein n=1 Tax=Albidovulum marisflavi TaxID=2984159 RepID=A0ABT2Z9T2_9RHOB|nr:Hint domain-containing protein [Defluviimonas sp. WL0002]MCV2867893.1 Hint domain-containing protein [Defluviimonas sp. WL0002]
MAISDSFWVRADSVTANNATLNPIKTSGSGGVPVTQIYFESGTLGSNTTGDLQLDYIDGATADPDTTVWIDGVEYNFIYVLSGTLPDNSQTNGQQTQTGLVGKEVTLIEVIGLPSGNSNNTQFFFVNDGTATQAQMEAFGTGAIPLTSTTTTPPPVCFLRGTLIATPSGEVPVESLKEGDEVLTASGSVATVRFAASRVLSDSELRFRPEMRPVCIPAGAMGDGLPKSDLWVSPQHRVLVRGWEAEMLFGEPEVLVAAKHVKVAAPHVPQPEAVEYFHLMLDRHDIVLSNGAETESLFPGDTAIASLTDEARADMERAFPEFAGDWTFYGPTARRTLTAKEAEALWTKMAPLGAQAAKAVA